MNQPVSTPPSQPPQTVVNKQGLADLRFMQKVSLALLVAVAVLFLLSHWVAATHPAMGYARAFCEAAMVGGLADWFAVTALFRYPMGLKIPHTAILQNKKDQFGDVLGKFIENNFLTPETVVRKYAGADFTAQIARWLADPQQASRIASNLSAHVPLLFEALADPPVRKLIEENLRAGLNRVEIAALLAQVLDVLRTQESHQALADALIRRAQRLVHDAGPDVHIRVRRKTAWIWRQLGIDYAISEQIITAARDTLSEVSENPSHPWRQQFNQMTSDFIAALRTNTEYRQQVEAFKQALLEDPVVGEYLASVLESARNSVQNDINSPDSRIRTHLEAVIKYLGETLLQQSAAREIVNDWVRQGMVYLVKTRRNEFASLITATVREWDGRTVSERIEHSIGSDLQFIRINGTLVGGSVGVLLHYISESLLI